MINMSNEIIDSNEMNLIHQVVIKNINHEMDSVSRSDNAKTLPKEAADELMVKECRHEKSERRINDNKYYRGPARRLNIDRRK